MKTDTIHGILDMELCVEAKKSKSIPDGLIGALTIILNQTQMDDRKILDES